MASVFLTRSAKQVIGTVADGYLINDDSNSSIMSRHCVGDLGEESRAEHNGLLATGAIIPFKLEDHK